MGYLKDYGIKYNYSLIINYQLLPRFILVDPQFRKMGFSLVSFFPHVPLFILACDPPPSIFFS